ncbi:DUF1707 SHOCT-like domain-containing protein [Nocardioides sp. URHA0020]|uniref:DUF1707 SHOCT-like domain-containing protein n=1 Tax=Nocardioides sp. URHA0020 TaxID=1380392 RepID=UPI00048FCCF0|nr:DUF1707 domain-containing protein [Nocardioides sp. URHA0020]
MNGDQLRIGDVERDQAAAALGEHYAQGRLTVDEHAERLDQIWSARTRADLRPVFRDLPEAHQPSARRTTGRPRLLVPVLVALLVLTVLTHAPFLLVAVVVGLVVLTRRRRWRGPARQWSR